MREGRREESFLPAALDIIFNSSVLTSSLTVSMLCTSPSSRSIVAAAAAAAAAVVVVAAAASSSRDERRVVVSWCAVRAAVSWAWRDRASGGVRCRD